MSTGWDNATLKKLKALTGKGLSTAEIGKRLGMSKNAIVGKLNRLGWNTSATEGKPVAAVKKTPAKKIPAKPAPVKPIAKKISAPKMPVKKIAAPKVAPAPVPKKSAIPKDARSMAMHQRIVNHSMSMASLRPDQCRWPIGDPDSESFHFCGAPVFAGKPYCYEHCKQAYQFNPPKKK